MKNPNTPPDFFKKKADVMDIMLNGRIPPQALDAEQVVLGAIMLEKEAFDKTLGILSIEMFYKEAHKILYRAFSALKAKYEPIDLITVVHQLRHTDELEHVGGMYYLTELTSKVASDANIEHHSLIIAKKHYQRERIKVGQAIVASGFADVEDPLDALETDIAKLREILPMSKPMVEASDLVVPVIDRIEAAMRGESRSIYLGFRDIDAEYAFETGELVVVPADSGTGKTALAWEIAMGIRRIHPNIPIIFNCLEMEGEQLVARNMASRMNISQMRMRTGRGITKEHIGEMAVMPGKYKGIYVTKEWTNELLRLKIRQLRKQLGLKETDPVVVIGDNLQIYQGEKGGNREQEVASIGRSSKVVAVDEKVLYFMLAQVNKANGKERPTKKNIRESVAPGNDADWVLILFSPMANGEATYEDGSSTANILEVIFDKVRFGKGGAIVKLRMSDYGLITDIPINDLFSGDFDIESKLPKIQPKDITISNSEREDNFPF